jgi:hypothetical protein
MVPFRAFLTETLSAGLTIIGYNLAPSPSGRPILGAKVQAMSLLYQYYRVKNLTIEFYPPETVSTPKVDFGYSTHQLSGSPTSLEQIVELPWSATFNNTETVPKRFRVNLMHGLNQLPRFDTVPSSSGDPNLQTQGQLFFGMASGGTAYLNFYLRGTIEFSGFIDAGLPSLLRNHFQPASDEKDADSDFGIHPPGGPPNSPFFVAGRAEPLAPAVRSDAQSVEQKEVALVNPSQPHHTLPRVAAPFTALRR